MTPAAWAQPPVSRNSTGDQAAPAQRRAELRSVLKSPRRQELDRRNQQIFENVAYDRHLSTQERADLREQLRQQRLDAISVRP